MIHSWAFLLHTQLCEGCPGRARFEAILNTSDSRGPEGQPRVPGVTAVASLGGGSRIRPCRAGADWNQGFKGPGRAAGSRPGSAAEPAAILPQHHRPPGSEGELPVGGGLGPRRAWGAQSHLAPGCHAGPFYCLLFSSRCFTERPGSFSGLCSAISSVGSRAGGRLGPEDQGTCVSGPGHGWPHADGGSWNHRPGGPCRRLSSPCPDSSMGP